MADDKEISSNNGFQVLSSSEREKQIDELVFELYELTEEERKVVFVELNFSENRNILFFAIPKNSLSSPPLSA